MLGRHAAAVEEERQSQESPGSANHGEPRRGATVVILTERAKAKLEESIREKGASRRKGIRLVLTPLSEKPLNFILDEEETGDLVIRNHRGANLLFVRPALRSALDGMVIDYCETAMGCGFTLTMRPSVN